MMHLENSITSLGNAGLIRDHWPAVSDWPGYRNADAVLTHLTTGLNANASQIFFTAFWHLLMIYQQHKVSLTTPPRAVWSVILCLIGKSGCLSPPPAIWTCKVSVHHQQYGHAGFLSITSNIDVQGVRNKETQSGTGKPRCRTEMSGCRCRWNQPRCRCPGMLRWLAWAEAVAGAVSLVHLQLCRTINLGDKNLINRKQETQTWKQM